MGNIEKLSMKIDEYNKIVEEYNNKFILFCDFREINEIKKLEKEINELERKINRLNKHLPISLEIFDIGA